MVIGFRQVASLTALSRVLGMLRDMAFAYFLGRSGLMDGWAIAFKIPNLARRLFGEGAAASSLIPVYSELLHTDKKQARRLASTVVTAVFLLLMVVVLIGEAIIWGYYHFVSTHPSTNLKLALAGIMLPYMILICVVALVAGVLQAHRHFAAPAAAPVVLNLFIIGSLCFSGWVIQMQPARQVFVVAVAVLIAGVAQLAIQLPALRARHIRLTPGWDFRSQPFRRVIFMMGPMVLGLTVTQINTLADDFIALWLSGSPDKGHFFSLFGHQLRYPLWEGAVSQLYYSQRLYQFPLGVLGISLATVIFPIMSSDAARNEMGALCRTISRGLRCAVFVAVPATVGIILVAEPLTSAVFEQGRFTAADAHATARTLLFYSIGLCGFFTQQIVIRAFYSVQDSKMPALTALVAVVANITLNLTLVWSLRTAGLALSTAVCSYLQVFILLAVLRRRFGRLVFDGLMKTLLKTLVATGIMAVVATLLISLMDALAASRVYNVVRLLAVVPSAAAAYVLAARALRMDTLSLLTGSAGRAE